MERFPTHKAGKNGRLLTEHLIPAIIPRGTGSTLNSVFGVISLVPLVPGWSMKLYDHGHLQHHDWSLGVLDMPQNHNWKAL